MNLIKSKSLFIFKKFYVISRFVSLCNLSSYNSCELNLFRKSCGILDIHVFLFRKSLLKYINLFPFLCGNFVIFYNNLSVFVRLFTKSFNIKFIVDTIFRNELISRSLVYILVKYSSFSKLYNELLLVIENVYKFFYSTLVIFNENYECR